MSITNPSVGFDAATGAVLTGWEHVLQSLSDIFTTGFGERIIREWYGSFVPNLLGQLITPDEVTPFFVAITSAIEIVVTANNQGQSYEENLRKYEGASSKPSQLPQVIYLEDNALGEMVDKGQVLPAEGCMKADDYDITQITPIEALNLLHYLQRKTLEFEPR